MWKIFLVFLVPASLFLFFVVDISFAQPSFGRGGNRFDAGRGGREGERSPGGPQFGGPQFGGPQFGGRSSFSGRPSFGGRFGGDRGGDRGGERQRGGFDPTEMLKRFDRNGDGRIDPKELDERTREFAGRMIERMGFDPNKPVSINEISKKIAERRGEVNPAEEPNKEELAKTFGIPGFQDAVDEIPPLVPDFYLDPNSPVLLVGAIESRYDQSIVDQVNRSIRSYDRNGDGILDSEEIRRGRFSNPPVEESDLDRDGKLSKVELAERYVQRAGGRGRLNDKKASTPARGSEERSNRWSGFRRERGGQDNDPRSREERANPTASGQRESDRRSNSTSSSTRSRSSSRSRASSSGDKVASYAKSMLAKYDKDGDKVLNVEEAKSVSSLPKNADSNKDGNVTLDELIIAYGGQSRGGGESRDPDRRNTRRKSTSNNPYIIKSGVDRNAEADRDFRKLDKNLDGILQMNEFAITWSDDLAEQFMELDKDNDGVLTVTEWAAPRRRR